MALIGSSIYIVNFVFFYAGATLAQNEGPLFDMLKIQPKSHCCHLVNPFSANFPILYRLKTTENPEVFTRYRMGTLVQMGLVFDSVFDRSNYQKNGFVEETSSAMPQTSSLLYRGTSTYECKEMFYLQ